MRFQRRSLRRMAVLAGVVLLACCASARQAGSAEAATPRSQATPSRRDAAEDRITVLYDAFGRDSSLKKDWGFSALVEIGGKRILFDTGNDSEILAHNVRAKGVDLTRLDFVVMSHRHGDHIGGLSYLLSVNPRVAIYAPKENFGVFGSSLPGTFYRRNESLPRDMRYFDGEPPETLRFGTPWPQSQVTWIAETTEVAPGFHLILLRGSWGVDLVGRMDRAGSLHRRARVRDSAEDLRSSVPVCRPRHNDRARSQSRTAALVLVTRR